MKTESPVNRKHSDKDAVMLNAGGHNSLNKVVDMQRYNIKDSAFQQICKSDIDNNGVLVLPGFLTQDAVSTIAQEGNAHQHLAYYTNTDHNIYLRPSDAQFPEHHPRNRLVTSSKGCITTDQIPADSLLQLLYASDTFRNFLCTVLGIQQLYEYADPLSSINLHYAACDQELGWHFDNSSFAITLLIQKPDDGGTFEYVKDVRDADSGEMNFEASQRILDGETRVQKLAMDAGSLVLFRGRNSLHRVTPTIGDTTRMLVVLAYNTEPDIALSESARMTFYGRLR